MGEKFLNLSGLSLYDRSLKGWSQDKIKEAINKLSAVAKSGSYHDLLDKTHDAKVSTRVLEDTSIQFAYRSEDFNKTTDYSCTPIYSDGESGISCQLVNNYFYNVTFDGVLYENLLAKSVLFTDPIYSDSNYVGIGNRSLFTNPVLRDVTEEEASIPFYLVALDSAGTDDTYSLSTVWLFTKEKGTYTFTVQCTGKKKYEAKPLVSIGMYAYGATTMEELEAIMGSETPPSPPIFDPNETYTFTFGNNTYNLSPKFVNGGDFGGEDATVTYFGSEDLISAATSALGGGELPFEQHEDGDFAALIFPIPDGNGQVLFATATSLPLEINPDYNAAGPYTFNFIAPGYYADMQILQGQITDLDPFTQTFYADMSSGGQVITPVLTEQEVTLETLDIDRESYAIAYQKNLLGEYLLGQDIENINNGSQKNTPYINDKYSDDCRPFVWVKDGTIYYGNAFLLEDFSDVYDLSTYDEESVEYMKKCCFLIKMEQTSDYNSSNRMYNVTFYTKNHGHFKIIPSSSDYNRFFEFTSKYETVGYNFNNNKYSAFPEKVLENNIFVVDWYKCLSDNLKLVKGQKLSILLGENTYELEVKEDETTGFVYAGNPEYLPIPFFVSNLDYSREKVNAPFVICSIKHQDRSGYVQDRLTTRVFFDKDIISELTYFKVSYDTVTVTEPFKSEVVESSLPSLDWNVNEYSSNSHIINRTHFDSRKGHGYLPQLAFFYKSLYDSNQGGYYAHFPTFDLNYNCKLSLALKHNDSIFFTREYDVSFDPNTEVTYTQQMSFKNDDFYVELFGDSNNKDILNYMNFFIDYSILTEEAKQDLQNVTIDVEIITDSETTSFLGCTYQPRPSSGYSSGFGAYYRYGSSNKRAKKYNHVTRTNEEFYVTNYKFREPYLKSLPFARDSIYTVIFNGKKYLFKSLESSKSSVYYLFLGSYNYGMCGLSDTYNYPYSWGSYHTEYDDFKFGITLRYELDSNGTYKFTDGTLSIDSSETNQNMIYPNFTGLDIYYGELKELDSKYIPKAKEITDGSDGFTTGGQVYDYVERLTISDSFINGLFSTP